MRNGRGVGSGGGGFGHDDTQSTHEQAGRTPCRKKTQIRNIKIGDFLRLQPKRFFASEK